MDVRRFTAMAVDGCNLVMYDRNNFQRDTSLDAWKRRWVLLKKWGVRILIDVRFANTPFIRFLQEVLHCRRL